MAACANVALDRAVETIERDHRHAKLLAKGINERTPEALKSVSHFDFVKSDNNRFFKDI